MKTLNIALFLIALAIPAVAIEPNQVNRSGNTVWMSSPVQECRDCVAISVYSIDPAIVLFRVTLTLQDGTKLMQSADRNAPQAGTPYGAPSVFLFHTPLVTSTLITIASYTAAKETTPPSQ